METSAVRPTSTMASENDVSMTESTYGSDIANILRGLEEPVAMTEDQERNAERRAARLEARRARKAEMRETAPDFQFKHLKYRNRDSKRVRKEDGVNKKGSEERAPRGVTKAQWREKKRQAALAWLYSDEHSQAELDYVQRSYLGRTFPNEFPQWDFHAGKNQVTTPWTEAEQAAAEVAKQVSQTLVVPDKVQSRKERKDKRETERQVLDGFDKMMLN